MRTLNGLVLALVLAFGAPAFIHAQAQPPETRPVPAPPIDRADDKDWGWVGLLGLAGLAGLLGLRRDYAGDRHGRVTTGTTR